MYLINGKKVIDATEPITIVVTAKDVTKARQRDIGECPLAQSIRKQRDVINPRIGASIALIEFDEVVRRYGYPPRTKDRISVFDQDGGFKPGEYQFVPPRVKIGDRKGTKPGSNKREGVVKNVTNKPLRHL